MTNQFDNTPKSLDDFAKNKLDALDARHQRRHLFDHQRGAHMKATRQGVGNIISFTDNDYLGLSTDPQVVEAAVLATEQYGAGSGASRLVTGNCPLNTVLERSIAELKSTEDAVLFGSGYLANVGIIGTLMGASDLIIADELIHTSLHAGMNLSGATVYFFRHNDHEHAKELLRKHRHDHPRAMILVDGVYSMDGDIAPLKELGLIAKVFDAWLMSDDAHGIGVIGEGRGSAHACGADHLVPLQMGTLSKAVGTYGGYLAASKNICDLMRNRARSLIYTTGLPPAALGASIKSLEIIKQNPARCERPLLLAKTFAEALGLPAPETPIVPLVIGSEKDALAASKSLSDAGFLVWAFRPPTVPEGTSRLRFCFSAAHTDQDLNRLIQNCLKLNLKVKA